MPAKKPENVGTRPDRFGSKNRIWQRCQMGGRDECWPWMGCKNQKGYGLMSFEGRTRLVTHVALMLDGRPRPNKLMAIHSCHNPPCINPNHLRWGTAKNNSDDMMDAARGFWHSGESHWSKKNPQKFHRGDNHWTRKFPEELSRGSNHHSKTNPDTVLKGINNGNSKLTEEDVKAIKNWPKFRGITVYLATIFNVKQPQISAIRLGKSWRHIK